MNTETPINIAQDRVQWDLVDMIMKFRLHKRRGISSEAKRLSVSQKDFGPWSYFSKTELHGRYKG